MLIRQFCLGNNLLTHRENTDFFQQKPRQLPSAEASFEGCDAFLSKNVLRIFIHASFLLD